MKENERAELADTPEPEKPQYSASDTARYIFDSYYDRDSSFDQKELADIGIARYLHPPSTMTDKLGVEGVLDGEPVSQTLGIRSDGVWVFATTYLKKNGPLVQYQFKPHSDRDKSELIIDALNQSVFMQKLNNLKTNSSS